jgi:VWFA-related protein
VRFFRLTAVGVSLAVCSLVAQGPPPTFRSSVDVIAVDVQVVDGEGAPFTSLRPEQFTVTIDGKRRRVATADLVGVDPAPASTGAPAPAASPAAVAAAEAQPGRVYVLAFDATSFTALGVAPAREAARKFVSELRPNDLVGLVVLPNGPTIDVTADRGQIFTALGQIIGQARTMAMGRFQLSPSDIADLSRDDFVTCDFTSDDPVECIRRLDPLAADKLIRLCPDPERDERRFCVRAALMEGKTTAQFEEADIVERLSGFRTMLRLLGLASKRKVVVLVSAGILSTDRSGGRPDVGDVGRLVGQAAAQANASVYTLFIDRERSDQTTASRRSFGARESARDSVLLSGPLERIAAASGGAFFKVTPGGGEFFFDRILKETSAYYLLGVQPEPQDRDGRPHQLKITVAQQKVTVRGRAWFVLPRSGPTPLPSAAAAIAAPLPPRPLPDTIRPVAAAYERREYDAVGQSLSRVPDLANAMRDLRLADPPWPNSPRRGPTFALELALLGLASNNGFVRDEAVRLLTQAHVQVERSPDDGFACAWFLTEAAGLENLWQPDFSLPYVARALARCTAEPRLQLARGVMLEQQLGEGSDSPRSQEILAAYANAAKGETALEATLRSAWFAVRHGAAQQAVASLQEQTAPSSDPYVRYIYAMVQGHALRAVGRAEAAEAAYRRALEVSPGAQSARVALLTLMLSRGQTEEAEKLAESVQTAGRDQIDPWWTYSRGDARMFPAILARLRELVQ